MASVHTLSIATAHAIHRLLDDPSPSLIDEAIELAQRARDSLEMDNTSMCAAMMFAQPLVRQWQPHWRFSYVVGVILGMKYTVDGFFIADVIEHLTQEFPLSTLQAGEVIALKDFDWCDISGRQRSFRNALVNVALERAVELDGNPEPSDEDIHVMIVDDSDFVRDIHTQFVRLLRPNARIMTCWR
jgi:hypothetical protein